MVAAKMTVKKPMPEAARTKAWASSWSEDKDEPGTPPSVCNRVTRPIISLILINQEMQYFFFIILLLIFLHLGISQFDLASLCIA